MSVEITTPHACAWPVPRLNSRKMTAGAASPASAAITGTAARDRSVSSPITSSCLTSSPTVKKKSVMSTSLTNSCRVRCASKPPTVSSISVAHKASYVEPHGEFAHAIAAAVKTRRSSAAKRSEVRAFRACRRTTGPMVVAAALLMQSA